MDLFKVGSEMVEVVGDHYSTTENVSVYVDHL